MKPKNIQEWVTITISIVALIISIFTIFQTDAISKRQNEVEALRLAYEAWDLIAGEKGAQALDHIEQSKFKQEEARRLFIRAILLADNNAEVLELYGVFLGAIGEHEKALEVLESAKVFAPSSSFAPPDHVIYLDIGIVSLRLEKYEEAKNNFLHSLQLNPENPFAYEGLGSANFALGLEEEALNAYSKAVDIKPDLALANYNLKLLRDDIEFKSQQSQR